MDAGRNDQIISYGDYRWICLEQNNAEDSICFLKSKYLEIETSPALLSSYHHVS